MIPRSLHSTTLHCLARPGGFLDYPRRNEDQNVARSMLFAHCKTVTDVSNCMTPGRTLHLGATRLIAPMVVRLAASSLWPGRSRTTFQLAEAQRTTVLYSHMPLSPDRRKCLGGALQLLRRAGGQESPGKGRSRRLEVVAASCWMKLDSDVMRIKSAASGSVRLLSAQPRRPWPRETGGTTEEAPSPPTAALRFGSENMGRFRSVMQKRGKSAHHSCRQGRAPVGPRRCQCSPRRAAPPFDT